VLTLDVTPAITDDALADGTAGWGRFLDSDDEAVVDGAVGSEITLSDTSLETGQTVTVVSATLTLPA
jgi:putative cofactor-binding repeat protein